MQALSKMLLYLNGGGKNVEEQRTLEPGEYIRTYQSKCLTDASKVTHTITFRKATCTRIDDPIIYFSCSRDSKCVKCQQNYL